MGDVFVCGPREGCKCDQNGKLCEWPCWQRVGLTAMPCCPECAPLPSPAPPSTDVAVKL